MRVSEKKSRSSNSGNSATFLALSIFKGAPILLDAY